TEYWDKGLDTNQVPYEILSEYLEQDLRTTAQVFFKLQCEIDRVSRDMTTCIRMAMLDLGILADIEQNGLLYDTDKSLQKGEE
ncbi:DNA polymerase, partial [Loigolactobacillus coryniformis]|uniref:DNA polymerase n=1 Tax=Loigolactobacillus coryniformis TaxID=1610 RepID=UPI00201AB687